LMLNTGDTTFTLPATSTMFMFLPEIGSERTWKIYNATSTAGIDLTLSAGTGMDLVSASTTSSIVKNTEWVNMTCKRIYYRTADNLNVVCDLEKAGDY